MPRVTGPLFSQDASGSFAKAVNFSSNRGVKYARKIPHPTNPKTAPQLGSRAMFAFLSSVWKASSPSDQASWAGAALNRPLSPFNAYLSANLRRWVSYNTPLRANTPPGPDPRIRASFLSITPGLKHLRITITKIGLTYPWAYAVHHSLAPGLTPTPSNCVAVFLFTGTVQVWQHAPLPSGVTCYYVVRGFSPDGWHGGASIETSGTPL